MCFFLLKCSFPRILQRQMFEADPHLNAPSLTLKGVSAHKRDRTIFMSRPSRPRDRAQLNLRPSFVHYVERRFRGPAETVEPGRGHNLPNPCLAGLGPQAQSDFL